jgi:heat shock protein HslJ
MDSRRGRNAGRAGGRIAESPIERLQDMKDARMMAPPRDEALGRRADPRRVGSLSGRCTILALLLVVGCTDETVSGYAAPGPWRLVELDGTAVPPGTTLRFPAEGRVEGTLPCNTFRAQQTAPYPWFILSHFEVGSERCEARPLEERIVHALASVTLAEAQGPVLILTNDEGRELVFRRD